MLHKVITTALCGLAIVSASACTRVFNDINGTNSPMVTRTVTGIKGNFNGVEASTGFDVTYTVGSAPSVVLECSENAIKLADVYVKDGTLHIGIKKHSGSLNNVKLRARVTGPALNNISVSSGADIKVTSAMSIAGGTLNLAASSGADIDISSLSYRIVNAAASSGADIDIDEANATTLNATASSGADIDINALHAETVNATSSSGADISLAGVVTTANLTASSSGDISAKALNARNGRASASSSGDIDCNIRNISASHSSGGSVSNR